MEEGMEGWDLILEKELKSSYYLKLKEFLKEERRSNRIFPDENLVFEALRKTPFSKVRVVILGQDPYHGIGQADGLCFSVRKEVKLPPSLKNIFKEIKRTCEKVSFETGCLDNWAKQGVLLLNTVLTVREGEAFSHRKQGWELFTDAILRKILEKEEKIIFVLLGNKAHEKMDSLIKNNTQHIILKSAHPSPLSARFFHGCGIFSQVNTYLSAFNTEPIDWSTL